MKKNTKLAAVLLAGSLLLSGCAENPADNVPSANVSSTPVAQSTPQASVTPDATPVDGTVYAFAEATQVDFVGSKAVMGSQSGGFKKVDGSVTVPGDNLEQAVVDLTIDMESVFSDDPKLTKHLKSEDFFDVPNNPTSSFKSSSIAKLDEGFNVSGNLTLRGVTKTISFPATISVEGDTLTTKAEFSINRKDFNIVYAGKADNLIRDDVVIKFDVTAKKGG
jgi:polyisoprenoid-binding protein YceI